MQSGEAPLLFDVKWYHLWKNNYSAYYQNGGGKLLSFQPFNVNVQWGVARNNVTVVLLNFGVTASWNARRTPKPIPEGFTPANEVKMRCYCGQPAGAVMPVCEAHAKELLTAPEAPPVGP